MAGSVGLALGGALLVALAAAVMVAQLRASVEQRKVAVFGHWLTADASGRADTAFTAVDAASARPVAVGAAAGVGPTGVGPTGVGPTGVVFVVAGLPFYHRAGCQLLEGRSVTELDPSVSALPPGTSPCRLCEPS